MKQKPKEEPTNAGNDSGNLPAIRPASPLSSRLLDGIGNYWSSLDINSYRGKAILQKALVTQDKKIDEVDGMEWVVRDMVAQYIELADEESGELRQATRLVLISPAGHMVSTVSEGAVNSFRQIIATFGRPPWPDGLKVLFERKKTRKGYFTYVVSVDPAQFKE